MSQQPSADLVFVAVGKALRSIVIGTAANLAVLMTSIGHDRAMAIAAEVDDEYGTALIDDGTFDRIVQETVRRCREEQRVT